jgi:C1A family cysteine protease
MVDVFQLGSGWLRDEPDARDHTHRHEKVLPTLEGTRVLRFLRSRLPLPERVDLRPWCSAVHYQGGFNTCAAHVVTGLVEYFQCKAFGKPFEASRLFLYKVTKNFLQQNGNVGVYIRQTMGALKLLGVPPEKFWPYVEPGTLESPNREDPRLDLEPTSFCYALAKDFKAITYYRLDDPADGSNPKALLRVIKSHLCAKIPLAFGFPLYPSLAQATSSGRIPFPTQAEQELGAHAVIAVGFDDDLEVPNTAPGGQAFKGALLIQNSWSDRWGEGGYGHLPYEFILQGLARDFWTLLDAAWVDTGQFQLDL